MRKGFTLIELLVVIAIIAILAAVVILTLNPAELLKQARDSNRVSDMATIKSGLALYMSDVSPVTLAPNGTTCFSSLSTASCIGTTRFSATYTATSAQSGVFVANGTGWVPVNFTAISSGSPLGALPKDPTNSGTLWYAYAADTTNNVYEINAKMESNKYKSGGSGDVESTDGGLGPNNVTLYQVGTAPNLSL